MPTLTDATDRHTVIDRRDREYICFPDVVRAEDGRLIVAYNESDKHIQPTRRVLLVRTSTDNGKTWSDILRMDSKHSHCPRLVKRAGGELLISDIVNCFHRSQDNGISWQVQPTTGVVHDMLDRVIELDDGSLLTTGHLHRGSFPHPAIGQANTEQMVYRSENNGANWTPYSVIARERNLVLCEASMTLMPDGRLLALMRENSFVYEPMYLCESHDQGGTWSDPVSTPLIGHRPTMGLTPDGDLLVTYRNVGPDGGTCAWLGTPEELAGDFKVHGRHPNPENPRITKEGLRVHNDAGTGDLVRYALRPMTDPRFAEATLEAEVRVDAAGENGCGLRLGTWWKIYPDHIRPDVENGEPIPLEPGQFNIIRLDYRGGRVTLSINGNERASIVVDDDHANTRGILFGAPYPFEDNAVDCTWKRVSLRITEPRMERAYDWDWKHGDGLPDQWVQDNILELKNDRNAAAPDFGYSGWTTLADGSFFCAYHHGGGDDEGYKPLFSAHVMGTRFYRTDFK